MEFLRSEKTVIYDLEGEDGEIYVRYSAGAWFKYMGSSLEAVNTGIEKLERAFQKYYDDYLKQSEYDEAELIVKMGRH